MKDIIKGGPVKGSKSKGGITRIGDEDSNCRKAGWPETKGGISTGAGNG